MHEVTVTVTSIEWDTDGVPESDLPMLPATYERLTITVHDGSNDEEILSEILNALVKEYNYLIKDVQYGIVSIRRVQD